MNTLIIIFVIIVAGVTIFVLARNTKNVSKNHGTGGGGGVHPKKRKQ